MYGIFACMNGGFYGFQVGKCYTSPMDPSRTFTRSLSWINQFATPKNGMPKECLCRKHHISRSGRNGDPLTNAGDEM